MSQPPHRYRPEIDGLRGVAIAAVVANHVDSRLVPGGFVGVDVFFVISGYLITCILLRDAAQGSLSFTRFYARRVRRLLPAAAVMSAVVMVLGGVLLLPRDFKDLGASLVAYSAMASNVLFWRWDDYFAGQTNTWPLLHTWSLAVEEQFYLVFPWLVFLVARRSRLIQAGTFASVCAGAFVISVWQSEHDARSAYYLLPSRAWEMLAGALCSVAPFPGGVPARVASALGLASAACIVAPMAVYSEQTVFPGWAALVPVAGTVGLISVTSTASPFWRKLLSTRWLVWVGLVSYSLYLWHWPLLTLVRYPWSGMGGSCPWPVSYVVGGLSLGVAWLSFRFIESPGRAARWSDARTLVSWAAVAGMTLAFGLVIHRTGGLPQRLPPNVVSLSRGMADWQPRRRETIDLPLRVVRSGVMPRIGRRDSGQAPDFVLWGDSHADALVPAFDQAAHERGKSGIALTRGGTPPLVGLTFARPGPGGPNWAFRDAAVGRIQRERPPCVVLAARWSGVLAADLSVEGRVATSPEDKQAFLAQSLSETIAILADAGVGQVWILGEVPAQRFNVPKQLALHALYGWQDVQPIGGAEFRRETAPLQQVFERASGDQVQFRDMAAVLSRVSEDGLMVGDAPAYSDDNHLSATAARAMAEYLAPIFDAHNDVQGAVHERHRPTLEIPIQRQ